MAKKQRTGLSQRIRERREEAALTQRDLAEAIGAGSPSRISAWETERQRPSRRYVERLEQVLGDLRVRARDGGGSYRSRPAQAWGVRIVASDKELAQAARWLKQDVNELGVDALKAVMTAPGVTQLDIATFSADDLLVHFASDDVTPLIEPDGVEVRVLLPARQDHNTVARFLEAYLLALDHPDEWPEGVEIRCFPSATSADSRRILHAKILTAHTAKGFVHLFGSANFTRNGFLYNVETLSLRTAADEGLLVETFDSAWEAADELTPDAAQFQVVMSFAEGRPIEQCFDYQEQAIVETIRRLQDDPPWQRGHGIVLRLPTGAGKTLVAVEVLLRYALDRFTVLWVSHMSELLDQAEATLERQTQANTAMRARLDHFRIGNEDELDFSEVERHELVFVTDAKLARLLEGLEPDEIERDHPLLLVVDEAHRCHEGSTRYHQILDVLDPDLVLGLTATPTFDRPPFAAYWNSKVVPDVPDYGAFRDALEEDGVLARLEGETVPTGKRFTISGQPGSPEIYLTNRVGDFADDEVAEQVVETYLNRCHGQKTLVFAVTIEHAERIVELFEDEDVHAASFHGGNENYPALSKKERREILADFRREDGLDVLVSVQLAAQGVDLPQVRNLILARPTFSSVLYGQMLGRGRRGPRMGGTETCRVFDLTWSFVDDQGRMLPVEQRTHVDLDLPGESDESIRAALYVGGNETARRCPICEEEFMALKAPRAIPFKAAAEWADGNLDAAKIFDWPAHVALFRNRRDQPFRCGDHESAAAALENFVYDGRTARAWQKGVARVYYLPVDDE